MVGERWGGKSNRDNGSQQNPFDHLSLPYSGVALPPDRYAVLSRRPTLGFGAQSNVYRNSLRPEAHSRCPLTTPAGLRYSA